MYAVIKTGGKQYRVQAGDVLVVEKLTGEPGANLTFSDVLMVGDEAGVTVGAPLVDGAIVTGALLETRKGEKVKIFKKIRRQGYRRTRGHRQTESVVRVLSVAGLGKTDKWDGELDLTPLAERNLRARNLARGAAAAEEKAAAKLVRKPAPAQASVKAAAPAPAKKAAPKAQAAAKAAPVEAAPAEAAATSAAETAAPKKAAPKKPAAPKAAKKDDSEA
jgi:large subunit ribosomal protein L21